MNSEALNILFDEAFENANKIPKESVPPNVQLVQGFSSSISSSFNASVKIPPSFSSGGIIVKTDLGPVRAKLTYLRELPIAA